MKRILILTVIASLSVLLGSSEIFGCEGCYHESYDYVKTIKELEEPAKTIALALWFGAYSSETIPDPRIWDVGNGRPFPTPGKTKQQPDKKYVAYVNFWNSHIAHVTTTDKMRGRFNHNTEKFAVLLPAKGETVLMNAAVSPTDSEHSYSFSLSNLSVRSMKNEKPLAAKLAVKLILANIKNYGGMSQSGWGLPGGSAPEVIFEKTIETKDNSGYELNLRDTLNKKLSNHEEKGYVSLMLQVTTLEGPTEKGQLVLSKSDEWATAAAKVFKGWKVIESGRYEKADIDRPGIRKYKASRLLLQEVNRRYIGPMVQRSMFDAMHDDKGPGDKNYRSAYSHIDIITFEAGAHLGRDPINKLPWTEWENSDGYYVKSVDLGTGYGRRWFARTTIPQQDMLRRELKLTGGDDPIELLIEGVLLKGNSGDMPNKIPLFLAAYGDKIHPYIKRELSKHDTPNIISGIVRPLAYIYTDATDTLLQSLYKKPKTKSAVAHALIMGKPRRAAKSIYMDILKKRRSILQAGMVCVTFGWMEAAEILQDIYDTPKSWHHLNDSYRVLRKLQQKPIDEDLRRAKSYILTFADSKKHSGIVKKACKTITESTDKQAAVIIAAHLAYGIGSKSGAKRVASKRIGRELIAGMDDHARPLLKKCIDNFTYDQVRQKLQDVLNSLPSNAPAVENNSPGD